MTTRYVALGSSMAAGPGIRPTADDAPAGAGRSAVNYPHLVADRLSYELVDVTFSGATTANVLTERQRGTPPQIEALDGTESLVTVTIGGNDVGYVPMLFAAGLPRWMRSVPFLGGRLGDLVDPTARDRALVAVEESLRNVGRAVRERAPRAKVLFVDYLTLLPPAGTPAPPLNDVDVALGRRVASTLERVTGDAATDTGCELGPSRGRQHEPPRVVRRSVDDEVRTSVAGQGRAVAPQRRRYEGGRRSDRGRADLRNVAPRLREVSSTADDGGMTVWLSPSQGRTWLGYMGVYHRLEYEMNRQLQAECGLSLADYTVMNALSAASGRRLRLSQLAINIGWERSRLSHHLQRMAARGLVDRVQSDTDGRATDAVLTDAGLKTLRAAAPKHVAWVRAAVLLRPRRRPGRGDG